MKIKVAFDKETGSPQSAFEYVKSALAALRQGALAFIAIWVMRPQIEALVPGLEVTNEVIAAFVLFAALGGTIEEALAYLRHKPALDEVVRNRIELEESA